MTKPNYRRPRKLNKRE